MAVDPENKARNMQGLREVLWDQIKMVQNKEIDLERAAVVIKAAETIISSFKVEIQHAVAFKKGPVQELAAPEPKDDKVVEGQFTVHELAPEKGSEE
jgi:hypothetical protein